jgi:hypothetical protein
VGITVDNLLLFYGVRALPNNRFTLTGEKRFEFGALCGDSNETWYVSKSPSISIVLLTILRPSCPFPTFFLWPSLAWGPYVWYMAAGVITFVSFEREYDRLAL